MSSIFRKPLVVALVVVILLGLGLFVYFGLIKKAPPEPVQPTELVASPLYKVIGTSVEGRKIESYTYGTGDKHLMFVGGIHGGYEWNSVLLAYQFMDYLNQNPSAVPAGLQISVVLAANPDAVYKVTGKEGRFGTADVSTDKLVLESARFNTNGVDLNRNFDCKWKPESSWKTKKVSAGTAAFSEPEAAAIRDFVLESKPKAVVFWHSQANAVYASECTAGILPETLEVMNTYAAASGYSPVKSFDAYEISGDAEGWLASIGIPAITVELKTHETVEWEQNLAGIKALLVQYAK